MGKQWKQWKTIFLGSKIIADADGCHEIKRHLFLGREAMTNLDTILKSRDITLSAKVCVVRAMVSPIVMYGCESWTIKESWALKNWCFWTVVLEKTLESPLDCKEIQPVHPKGSQSWIFIGRTYAEAPILRSPDAKSWLIGKDTDVGRDWRQEEKGTTGWDGWMVSPTQWTQVWVNSWSWWWTGRPGVHGVTKSWTWLSDWTELNWGEKGTP